MPDNQTEPRCIYCDCTGDEAPLVAFSYKNVTSHICSQHFPMLIHKPSQLADRLPGMESITPGEH
jgi:hypothetical protein